MKNSISAVILTKNEEKNISRCLKSLIWCDEVIVIDDYSDDKTIERIKDQESRIKNNNFKLKIYKKRLKSNFANQRNFGLSKAKTDWVLFVDADEQVPKTLADEIIYLIKHSDRGKMLNGYFVKRNDFFLGKWLKHGETANVNLLRLARINAGEWVGAVHETWKIERKVGQLNEPLMHYPHSSVSEFLQKINSYTDLVVQCWKGEGRAKPSWEIIFYPLSKFIYNYLFKLGFFDGVQGLIIAIMMSFHSFLSRSKYWLMMQRQ